MLAEPDDERLLIELRLRFTRGTDGPECMLRELERYRERLAQQSALAPITDLLHEIRMTRANADAVVTLELGRGRVAIKNLARLTMLVVRALFSDSAHVVEELQAVEGIDSIEEAPVEEPQPAQDAPPARKDPKRRGDG
jgi:hypothetical protein